MNLKSIIPAILCILVGFFMSNFMFNQYEKETIAKVSNEKNTVYFLQIGVYSSLDSMKENLKKFYCEVLKKISGSELELLVLDEATDAVCAGLLDEKCIVALAKNTEVIVSSPYTFP